MFELCKDTFPSEATIKCIENRLPGSIDITVMAVPCDGIYECRDGSDENCEEDKLSLVLAIAVLFLATICIYLYIIHVRLPSWKSSVFLDHDHGNIDLKLQTFDLSEMKGNKLAKLKVGFYYILWVLICHYELYFTFQNDTSQKQCAEVLATDNVFIKLKDRIFKYVNM